MAKRRTRQEKMLAALRRPAYRINVPRETTTTTDTFQPVKIRTAEPAFYQPELSLPINLVKYDLTKTLGVTILALILQWLLAVYLNRGGWQIVSNFLSQIKI